MTADQSKLCESRDALEHERLRLQTEITSYPMPIPGCDAYFNDLLEQRTRVCEELARVERLLASERSV